jgi:preprotein translocase SecE subunit
MADTRKDKAQDKTSSQEMRSSKHADKDVKKSQQATAKDSKKAPKKAQKKPGIFSRFFTYIGNVRQEVKRTTWPTRFEVLNMTIIVIIALLFFGALIFLIDQLMIFGVEWFAQFKYQAPVEVLEPALDAVSELEPSEGASLFIQQFLMGGK